MILDSNIIIYSYLPAYQPLLVWLERPDISFSVSAISQVEVLGFHNLTSEAKKNFEEFFSFTPVLALTVDIVQVAIHLRQQRKRSLGDAIIAATALIHNLPVVTNNIDDFSTVEGLTVISLADILSDKAS